MPQKHAIVIGGSVAGMCAARVLRRYFDRVTILDRDALPAKPTPRAGVPQSRHVHALLTRGWLEFERLFPGFQARMLAAGMHELDFGTDMATLRPACWQMPMKTDLFLRTASRDLAEVTLRALLHEAGDIEIRDRVRINALLTAPGDATRVTGVHVTPRSGAPFEFEADLVVDTSGHSTKAPVWLQSLGKAPPEETVVNSFAGYSSRWFKLSSGSRWPSAWWWRAIWIDPAPPDDLMGGVLFPIEDDRWIVTLIGFSRHYPPCDEAGFMRALRSLRSPAIAEAVALAEPISHVYSNRALVNRFRHYERSGDLPSRFIAMGDSVCVFNPTYGQGMTAAVLSATALEQVLGTMSALDPAFPRAFFHAQARVLSEPWALAVGADLGYPDTQGDRQPGLALLKKYTDALTEFMCDDEALLCRALRVFSLLEPTSTLLSPSVVGRVMAHALGRGLRTLIGKPPTSTMPPALAPNA